MTTDQQTQPSANGLAPLITGIVRDAQSLIRQQLSLFQSDIKNDLCRTKDAAGSLLAGVAVSVLAGFFLCLGAAHLAVWLWPEIPLFAAYGVVGCLLGIVGGLLVWAGKSKFDAFNLLAEKSVEGLKENVQWTSKT